MIELINFGISMDKVNEGLINTNLSTDIIRLSFIDGLTILLLALLAGYILRFVYKKYSTTFSSKNSYGNTILLITISVASLIAVVKSSLALSLGLVGALSVVRFRTAVKEPYNLSFLLLSICVGIGVGASQYTFAFMTLIIGTLSVYILYNYSGTKSSSSNDKSINMDTLVITLKPNSDLENIYNLIENRSLYYSLISLEEIPNEKITITIRIKFRNLDNFNFLRKDIIETFDNPEILFLNSPTI
tara:strand:+ start:545 stop:1279 length:735 start_codon:yes stop_codon:yes gene_type:complete